ncbi:Apoptogenic protein 1, mitochondrial [Chionoecetes opilio]|uniref:Apoptogenic protein 1, mitochondrial n=1 Tax=Chionoecetes opilio TaxID=41210 RepID=A0A8J4YDM1_CHIOP|nr:Apoptogenic protein 1, mitochondrial [Chionoecetes opilio]
MQRVSGQVWVLQSGAARCLPGRVCLSVSATAGTSDKPRRKAKKHTTTATPEEQKCDYVGPPDSLSSLRHTRFYAPPDETSLERRYREARSDTQEWNQAFWASHNAKFKTQKVFNSLRNIHAPRAVGVRGQTEVMQVSCECHVPQAEAAVTIVPVKIILRLAFREGCLLKSDYEADGENITEVRLQKRRAARSRKMRQEFIETKLKEKYGDSEGRKTLTADEMSQFYKGFLDDHLSLHTQYNKEWYWRNGTNILLAARVWLQQKMSSDR